MTFTTIYRTGGTKTCQWKACLPVATREQAQAQAEDCERMGYKALVHRTAHLEAAGLPNGWEA